MDADFILDNIVFKFQLKNSSSPVQIRHFWSQIKRILFLHQTLQQEKFEETDLHKLGAFLVPNLKTLFLHQALQLDKFEGVDFKYDHYFF